MSRRFACPSGRRALHRNEGRRAVEILGRKGLEACRGFISGKLSYQDMMDEAKQKESLPEELTKFEKELNVYLRDKKEVVDENNQRFSITEDSSQ